MIILVGVGHVFKIADKIRYMVHTLRPDAVAVELDPVRLEMLMHRDEYEMDPKAPLGLKMMAKIQEKVAKNYGVEAGSEMLAGIAAAQECNIPGLLIDNGAMDLLNNMWKEMKFTEKAKFLSGLVGSQVLPSIGHKGQTLEEALEDFDDDPEKFMAELEKHFPKIKKVLVDDRNVIMAENLIKANKRFKHILTIIGAGHVEGIKNILEEKGLEVRVMRLNELVLDPEKFMPALNRIKKELDDARARDRDLDADANSSVTFTYTYDDG